MSEEDNDFDELEDAEDLDEEESSGPDRTLLYVLPALFLVVCAALVWLNRGVRTPDAPLPPQSAVLPVVEGFDPLLENSHKMPIPFGMKARSACAATCSAAEAEKMVCFRSCDRYLTEFFARQIVPEELNPQTEADRIAAACETQWSGQTSLQERTAWEFAVQEYTKSLTELPAAVEFYQRKALLEKYARLSAFENMLTRPDGEDLKFPLELQVSLCLRESLVATQLAVLSMAEKRDLFSERWYRGLESALLKNISSRDAELQKARAAAGR